MITLISLKVGNTNSNGVDSGTLRNKYDSQVTKCVTSSANATFNRTSLFSDASVFKSSTHHERTSSSIQHDAVSNKRLLSTSSIDQAFGSSKSLSNTEVTSQTSVLSSASCSSSSSMLSSGCAMILGKDLSPGIRSGRHQNQNCSQSVNSTCFDDINQAEKSPTNGPPPIPPKTATSNQNQTNPLDPSAPALPTTPPPIHQNKSPDHNRTSMILDSITLKGTTGDKSSITGSFNMKQDIRKITNDNETTDGENLNNSNEKPISTNEKVISTSELINAVIYIDDEDDLGSPTEDEEKRQ